LVERDRRRKTVRQHPFRDNTLSTPGGRPGGGSTKSSCPRFAPTNASSFLLSVANAVGFLKKYRARMEQPTNQLPGQPKYRGRCRRCRSFSNGTPTNDRAFNPLPLVISPHGHSTCNDKPIPLFLRSFRFLLSSFRFLSVFRYGLDQTQHERAPIHFSSAFTAQPMLFFSSMPLTNTVQPDRQTGPVAKPTPPWVRAAKNYVGVTNSSLPLSWRKKVRSKFWRLWLAQVILGQPNTSKVSCPSLVYLAAKLTGALPKLMPGGVWPTRPKRHAPSACRPEQTQP